MGTFATAAQQHANLDQRGDGHCVVGRWENENLVDTDDIVEFSRLANEHKWALIIRLSGNKLRQKSLAAHVHGACVCSPRSTKGCCTSCTPEKEAS